MAQIGWKSMSVDTRIFDAYLESALKSNNLEGQYTIFDFGKEARDKTRDELEEFVGHAGDLLRGLGPEQIGHCFWLARNGDVATPWDVARDADLISIAAAYHPLKLSVGKDGRIALIDESDLTPMRAPR
jgi:hypothetical protein